MSSTLWLDPSFGASGDMLLGTLCGLLATASEPGFDILRSGLACLSDELDAADYSLDEQTVTRNGITANRVSVSISSTDHARRWSSIDAMLLASSLPDRAKIGARATFRRLGEVEAAQHNVDIEDVHFHEVGAIDAIVDIVGAWILLDHIVEHFDLTSVVVGPVGLGHGTVQAAHGTLPLPAPATAALLMGMRVRSLDTSTETCTPTGAALLAEFANSNGPIPNGVIKHIARGAGGRDPSTHPNVLSAFVLQNETSGNETSGTQAVVLATNIDDASPEVLARTIQLLLTAGADDAWIVPIVMKKGRAASELRVLTRPDLSSTLRDLLHRETGTLGVREEAVLKHILAREFVSIEIRGYAVTMKVGPHGAKPEHDELAELSNACGVPVRALALEAQAAFLALQPSNPQT